MAERVTIDVDPDLVGVLLTAAKALYPASTIPPSMPRTATCLRTLADAIEAALPIPEPAVGSVVRLRDGSVYGRTSDRDDARWVRMAGSGGRLWESWDRMRDRGAVLVFDGATLA